MESTNTIHNSISLQDYFAIVPSVLRGKTLLRSLNNRNLEQQRVYGKILDIGAGNTRGSHYDHIQFDANTVIETVDIDPSKDPTYLLNVEQDRLPILDSCFDFVFCFNLLEHISNRTYLLTETYRILNQNGTLLGNIPFLHRYHPDPSDYVRLTHEQLERELSQSSYRATRIIPIGSGPFIAAYAQIEFLIPRIIRVLCIPFAILLDLILQSLRPNRRFVEEFPLGYIFIGLK